MILLSHAALGQSGSNRVDTLLNSSDYIVFGKPTGNVKIVTKGDEAKHPNHHVLAKYQDDFILGQNITFEEVDINIKYKPVTSFEVYPVDVFKGKLTAPNFDSNPASKNFITRIKAACEGGINFAGHYTLVEWGCGTACQTGVLVDRKTGEIHVRPSSSLGTDFKPNSNLIIFNTGAINTKTNLIWVSGHSELRFEIWNGEKFTPVN